MNNINQIPVSIVVSVKNEELNLPKCLELLGRFNEVIVVDSKSTDNTPQIVKEFGYQLVDFNWNGQFPKKRNWTLENVQLKNDWVLFLDADEFITEAFKDEVNTTIKNTNHSGFWIYYNNYFLGKEQKFGLKMRKLALFKKNSGAFEKIEEDSWSHLDMEVHEHPVIKGKVGQIKQTSVRKEVKGIDHYIARHNAYSTWEAKRYMHNRTKGFDKLTFRQKLKYNLLASGLLPVLYFVGTYIFKFGFLDGVTGYYFAKYKSHYFFQIFTKIKELKAIEEDKQKSI